VQAPATRARAATAIVVASVALAAAGFIPASTPPVEVPPRPNVIVILTDDQTSDTLPTDPPAMPWLQSQIFGRPEGHWLWFPNAFLSTPLCCPSRASILTGQYAHHTGVLDNHQGENLDESNTLATWLQGAGYTTALFGKYLNEYPWDRGPYVPAGWSRFVGKNNTDLRQTYYGYQEIDQGIPLREGSSPDAYATDRFASQALTFLRGLPATEPYFMMFTPSAPHQPWTPAPRYLGAFRDVPVPVSSDRVLNDVRGKPGWIRSLPPVSGSDRAEIARSLRDERATLLAVDDAVREIVEEVRARGELDHTVIFFLTDNGFSFGQHRWYGKRCAYDPCIRTPFAVRAPWVGSGGRIEPVANVDLAPTIVDLANVDPGLPPDGMSLAGLLGAPGADLPPPSPDRPILIEWAGDTGVPAWQGVRTTDFAYIEDRDGTVELYDLTGVMGRPDPEELRNVAGQARYAATRRELADTLLRLASRGGGEG
jgi:N-acetylglucosamine-6-sulfatase